MVQEMADTDRLLHKTAQQKKNGEKDRNQSCPRISARLGVPLLPDCRVFPLVSVHVVTCKPRHCFLSHSSPNSSMCTSASELKNDERKSPKLQIDEKTRVARQKKKG